MAMLVSDKVNFREMKVTRDREGHYIRSIIDKMIISHRWYSNPTCIPTRQQSAKYIKQKPIELKRDINKLPVLVRDVNILLLSIGRITKQKNKDTEKCNITNQEDLINIYRTEKHFFLQVYMDIY